MVNSAKFRPRAASFPYIVGYLQSRLFFCYLPEFFLNSWYNLGLSKLTRADPRAQENMSSNIVSMAQKQGNIDNGSQVIFEKTMK